MKTFSYLPLLPLVCGAFLLNSAEAQGLGSAKKPTGLSAADVQRQAGSAQQPVMQMNQPQTGQMDHVPTVGKSHVDTDNGETPNPQVLGLEMPLLDPSSNTMTYNGAKFDVGNNAVVRARFEKYLQQNPDNSSDAKRYRKKMREVLKLTQKNARSRSEVGSENLVRIANGLYEMNEYVGDGGQSGALASAMASVIASQYANRSRNRKNEKMQKEIDKLVRTTNYLTTQNTGRSQGGANTVGAKNNSGGPPPVSNTFKIAYNTKKISTLEAAGLKHAAENVAATELAKINFQSTIISMLLQRRYNHAMIGAHAYRHLFSDGDTTLKLDSESQAAQMFEGGVGLPPTIGTMATMASTMRRDVDQNMEAVANMLAQNKLGAATDSLIQAVAVGEFMESVATFPVEGRRRIDKYWTLRKKALPALNARDYAELENIAAQMKEMDVDFDDTMLTSYCAGRKAQSDMHLRNAVKAMKAGDEATFNAEIMEAGKIWPKNPNIEKGREELAKIDNQDPVRDEFRTLISRKEFRTIYNEQDKFEVVAIDPELKQQYKEAITLIGTIDGMLAQLDVAAKQDVVMGPCMAYEMLLERGEQDARYKDDSQYREALNRYALAAHDFTQALEKAKRSEESREYGSALSNYYRAQCLYPRSTMAGEGAKRVTEIILKSKF